jgi:hypothetical protein
MKHISITLHITITDDGDSNPHNNSYKPYILPATGMNYPPRPAKSAWSRYLQTLPISSKQKSEAVKVIKFPTCKLLKGSK